MPDNTLIAILIVCAALAILLDDGASERWCETYKGWCENTEDKWKTK